MTAEEAIALITDMEYLALFNKNRAEILKQFGLTPEAHTMFYETGESDDELAERDCMSGIALHALGEMERALQRFLSKRGRMALDEHLHEMLLVVQPIANQAKRDADIDGIDLLTGFHTRLQLPLLDGFKPVPAYQLRHVEAKQ